jgi:hypothetical protein
MTDDRQQTLKDNEVADPDSYAKGYAAACLNILKMVDEGCSVTAVRIHCTQQLWAVNRYVS